MDTKTQILTNLLWEVYRENPVGSLANLRKVLARMDFISTDEVTIANDLVGYAHLAGFNLAENNGYHAAEYFHKAGNRVQLLQVLRLAQLYEQSETLEFLRQNGYPVDSLSISQFSGGYYHNREQIDDAFRRYCDKNGVVIIRTLQMGIDSIRRCSWVYLVWDKDGIVKIFKEVLDYNHGPLTGRTNREDELYAQL